MKGDPDPLDGHDPRVLLEWEDKLGQIIRPGDYVAKSNYSALSIGKVLLISALRKDGKPFKNSSPQMLLHLCNLTEMELGYWKRMTNWNTVTHQHDDFEMVPSVHVEKWPRLNVVRVDWKPVSER